jgi:ComF family protein
MSSAKPVKLWQTIGKIADFLLPNSCLQCQQVMRSDDQPPFCKACSSTLPLLMNGCAQCAVPLSGEHREQLICGQCQKAPPAFEQTTCFRPYSKPFSGWIAKYKYEKHLPTGLALSNDFLNQHSGRFLPQALIPVPLHKKRLKQRGYNQAALIAKHLSKHWEIPLLSNVAIRQKYTEQMIKLKKPEREKQITGAFKITTKIPYSHVAIVDDVMTSGATANELAKMLKKSGVAEVSVIVLCRAV